MSTKTMSQDEAAALWNRVAEAGEEETPTWDRLSKTHAAALLRFARAAAASQADERFVELPDGRQPQPGQRAKHLCDGLEVRGEVGSVDPDGLVRSSSGASIGRLDQGQWFVTRQSRTLPTQVPAHLTEVVDDQGRHYLYAALCSDGSFAGVDAAGEPREFHAESIIQCRLGQTALEQDEVDEDGTVWFHEVDAA